MRAFVIAVVLFTTMASARAEEARRALPLSVGGFIGIHFIHHDTALGGSYLAEREHFDDTWLLGARAGYRPIRWVAVELELEVGRASALGVREPATLVGTRALLRIPAVRSGAVEGFAIVGGGLRFVSTADERADGVESNAELHAGLGFTWDLGEGWAAVRLDLRYVADAGRTTGRAHSLEGHAGGQWSF